MDQELNAGLPTLLHYVSFHKQEGLHIEADLKGNKSYL